MSIPLKRIENKGLELTVPIVGFSAIKNNDTINLGAPIKEKTKSKHSKQDSPPRVVKAFKKEGKNHKTTDDWYKNVTDDLIVASTASTMDDLETNTIVKAESIHTINNLMNKVFQALNLPPRVKSGYNSLADLDKIKLLHSIVESSPDNFSRAMVNFPFYNGTDFVREIRTNPGFSNADKDSIRRDVMAGLASFSYSKGQTGGINIVNNKDVSVSDRRDIIATTSSNCVKSFNPRAVMDIIINSPAKDVRYLGDEIADQLIGLDRDPAKIDPEPASEIATVLTNCSISDINSIGVGRYCGLESHKVIEKRNSAQPKASTCLPLSDSGWTCALMEYGAKTKFERGRPLTEYFSEPDIIEYDIDPLTAEAFYKSNRGLPSYK